MTPKIRGAFTLIELLLVIVILGIIGFITLEAVRQYYEGIYRNSEYMKRAATADHVLEQVSKYFENAISASIVNIDKNALNEGTCKVPETGDAADDYTVAFVGVDQESLRGEWNATLGTYVPGWNEDVSVAGNTITMRGGSYTIADNITQAIWPGSSITDSAIYNNSGAGSACSAFNWDRAGNDTKYIPIVNNPTASTITTNNGILSDDNKKRAYLLRTGYAFRVNATTGDFMMYSNFRPWMGDPYTAGGIASVLARNVAHFYVDYDAQDFQNDSNVTDRGMVWRLKLCMRGIDANLSESSSSANDICRERRVHVRY